MANKNTTTSTSGDDIKVGVSVVQPTEEKLTVLETLKIKVPKLVKGPKVAKKEKTEKVSKETKSTAKKRTEKATKPKTTKTTEKDIEIDI